MARRAKPLGLPPELLRLEGMLTHKDGFGLETATPLQRAICRSLDGEDIGDLWEDSEVRAGFGDAKPEAWRPRTFVIAAAIRSAKSMTIAAKAICLSQTVDLTGVTVGDEIRIPILAPEKDEARAVFSHIVGNVVNRPKLRGLLVEDPTADAVRLRHPSGHVIEIKVTALSRFATTLIGRWLPAAIFDEAPRMVGEQDGVRNLPDALNAIAGRIRPGGTIMLIGSPHAPFGPMYDMIHEHFGRPSRDCVVVRATGPAMNPQYWTPARCEDLRRTNPEAYRTDVLAEFADPEEAMFGLDLVEACTRKHPQVREPEPGHYYVAAMDPATRGNAWTFILLECTGWKNVDGVMRPAFSVAMTKQWRGSKENPLRPDLVFAEIGALMKPYRCTSVITDQYACDALAPLAMPHGLMLVAHELTQGNKHEMAARLKLELDCGCLELAPDPVLCRDLVSVRRRITQNGVTVHLPETSDGRHADYVPALMLAIAYAPVTPDVSKPREPRFETMLIPDTSLLSGGDFWEGLADRMAS